MHEVIKRRNSVLGGGGGGGGGGGVKPCSEFLLRYIIHELRSHLHQRAIKGVSTLAMQTVQMQAPLTL